MGQAREVKSDARRGDWGGPLVLGIALFMGLSLAGSIVLDGVGDFLQDRQPQLALSLGRDSPGVLSAEADQEFHARHYARAARLSLASLDRSPLYVKALRVRALTLKAQGQLAPSVALLEFAGTRSWRDNETQAWLVQDGIEKKQYAEAFRHADALVRRREEMRPAIFKLFEIAAADPSASVALATRLATRPDWREDFLDALARSSQTDVAVAHLFDLVARGPAALNAKELGDYLGRLAREGRYRDAYLALKSQGNPAWTATVPFDGDFDDREGVSPFAWDKVGRKGVEMDILAGPGRPSDKALRVEYDGYSSTDLMQQALALEPGDYQLSGQFYGETGDPAQLGWEIRCAADSKKLVQAMAPAGAAMLWHGFVATFSVPRSGCDGQWLVLAGAPGERRTTVTVWYDKIHLSRIGPG